MCGIVGYISLEGKSFPIAKQHFLRYALALDTLRGPDSTGIIQLTGKFNVNTHHSVLSGMEYVNTKKFNDINKTTSWAMVGHNRAATKGSVKLANAHPFTFGDVSLVHNGTLYGGGTSLDTYDHKLEVDSMQIALALSLCSPEDAHKVLEQIDGSFAVVWTDKRDSSINIAKNRERPFSFTYNTARSIMLFMSDPHHLHTINKSMNRSDAAGTSIYNLENHKWLKMKKGSLRPEVRSFRPFVRPYVAPARGSWTSHSTGGKTSSAVQRAADKWGHDTKVNFSVYNTDDKVFINNVKRKVPAAMSDALEEMYDLSPKHMLEFKAEEYWEIGTHDCMVTGRVKIPDWGNSDWPAVIHHVPKVVATAYSSRPWAVRPMGVGKPFDDAPSVICSLYSNDWANTPGTPKEKKEDAFGIIVGPEGRAMAKWKVDEFLKEGCIQCGISPDITRVNECVIVNEGRDIVCGDCVKDNKSLGGLG